MKKKRRVIASIEARMGSSRLPGKVLKEIQGQPVLKLLINRLKKCDFLDDIIVATSISKTDDILHQWCLEENINCFRGSEEDVLDRVVKAHEYMESDIIVEITGDCPITDPQIVDLGVQTFLCHEVDVVTNCGSFKTWPMGQYVQVFTYKLLKDINERIDDYAVHEHVSLYFYEHPEIYNIFELIAPKRWREPSWRFQLDYPEDLEFQSIIHKELVPKYGLNFGIEEVVELLRNMPYLLDINKHCQEKPTR